MKNYDLTICCNLLFNYFYIINNNYWHINSGHHHEIFFEYCNCFGVAESLLQCGVWPATPVEPDLAFTLHLMEMTLRFMMECQVSIHDMLKAFDFFKNPVLKVERNN